ncbi:F16A2 protein, partial [Nesospiza acunhae]|nr:F16A2 protein [Nesospiza acunhae]
MERMSWLSKLTPRAGGQRAPRSASLQPPVTADPETCLMVFKNHWAQVLRILERRGSKPAPDDLSAVRNNTYQMLNLLAEDRPWGDGDKDRAQGDGDTACGPILEFVAAENLLERLLCWHLQGDFTEERKVEQLKLYEMLISQARQPLLRHKPVLTPLLRLLSVCAEPASAPLENSLVLLLNQLCVSVAREPAILELFFHSHTDQGPANLIIFSLLIPFIHHEGARGQQARDALLLIMAMSASNRAVAQSITDNSYFCPVLATGLSALYSSLPRKIEVRGDDWHFLRREDWIGVSSLVLFMNSLEFCNAVIQVAHPLVQKQLVDYVHNGFLVPVMGPALHKTSVEEMIASTAYLDLFLRSVSETALLKTFLRFVLLHRHDNTTILDTLVGRINSNSRLCMVSLSLFRTLLSLNCEDVMLQLVLRYLLPCSHVMLSQKRAVRDLDIYGKTAAKFLSLIPRCCRPESPPPPRDRDEEPPSRARGTPLRPLRAPHTSPWPLGPCPDTEPFPRIPAAPPGTELSALSPWCHSCGNLSPISTPSWHSSQCHATPIYLSPVLPLGSPVPPLQLLGPHLSTSSVLSLVPPSRGHLEFPQPRLSADPRADPAGDPSADPGSDPSADPGADPGAAPPPRAVGPPPSQPFTGGHGGTGRVPAACGALPDPAVSPGPFVSVLFGKLENMPHNSLYVNFLLTGLVAQLACYPQPLLRSFLLNTNMVFQPSVKSLLQVLGSVKNKIESFAATQEDFPALLFKAKKYLIARGRLDWAEGPGAVPALRRTDTLGEDVAVGWDLPGGLRVLQAAGSGRWGWGLHNVLPGVCAVCSAGDGGCNRGSGAARHGEALRVRNAVYCAVIFSEFLKELAAIAQAHAVTSPFLTE